VPSPPPPPPPRSILPLTLFGLGLALAFGLGFTWEGRCPPGGWLRDAAHLAMGHRKPAMDWVTLPAGDFTMGSDASAPQPLELEASADEGPIHAVSVPAFELTRHEVTVGQYRACVEVGVCDEPLVEGRRDETWSRPERFADHPVNRVSWRQATTFCDWIGARLPTEAEWEYAARGAGQDQPFPWGREPATCDRAVFNDYTNVSGRSRGCGARRPLPVCSMPAGDTAQGLCDMGGNVWEWVQDRYHPSYEGAPNDGSAWGEASEPGHRVVRGGGFTSYLHCLRVVNRRSRAPEAQNKNTGFRCARSTP
jgi:formylglycine-generating enzyme required for sulfatase activity